MFVGHTAVALAAKRWTPRVPLGVLVGAAFWLDLVWPLFLLLGIERVRIEPGNTRFTPLAFEWYPWSHSLLLVLGWSALLGWLWRRRAGTREAAIVVAALVSSHWVLDAVSHRPDLPLWPGSRILAGLGLWNSPAATLVVEGALFAAGLALYLATARPKDRTGTLALWSFVVVQLALWVAGAFGPPPPSAETVAWASLATWLLPVWAGWADRHHTLRAA